MASRFLHIIIFLSLFTATSLIAQEVTQQNRDTEKIKGTRHIPYPSYSGNPYLNDKFGVGEIEFADGSKTADLFLRYSTYKDELIYFNPVISAQIVIDKISLKGFWLIDKNGTKRVFRQHYYNGFLAGNRFFEVLSDGDVSLLVYRSVVLQNCAPYNSEAGILKNMEYLESFNYYLYNSKKGYELIRTGKNGLLSKFDKPNQKLVKKILRQNKLRIADELSFVKAWDLILKSGVKIIF